MELLKKAVAEKSQSAVSKESGLGLATINSYLKGVGEPTTATLETLAYYFGTSVAYLRGAKIITNKNRPNDDLDFDEAPSLVNMADDMIKVYNMVPDDLKPTLEIVICGLEDDIRDVLIQKVAGVQIENEEIINECLIRLKPIVDKYEARCEAALKKPEYS